MNENLVSVIIPIYNAEKYLEDCIKSILNQTYKNLQIILVNDGSKDNSISICEEYAKKDNRVEIINKKNGGVSSARNEGLKKAFGKYIQFLDSDDVLDFDYIEKMVYDLESSNADLIISKINIVTRDKNRAVDFEDDNLFNKQDINKLLSQRNSYGLISSPCNKIYKKELIKKHFPLELHNGEDALFNFEYIKNCKLIKTTNKCKYNYNYNNSESATKKFRESRFDDDLYVYSEMKKFFVNYNVDMKICNRILLRNICSITKALTKSTQYKRSTKKLLLKNMIYDEQIRIATKLYCSFGLAEKIAFTLIKFKFINLFYFCCMLTK